MKLVRYLQIGLILTILVIGFLLWTNSRSSTPLSAGEKRVIGTWKLKSGAGGETYWTFNEDRSHNVYHFLGGAFADTSMHEWSIVGGELKTIDMRSLSNNPVLNALAVAMATESDLISSVSNEELIIVTSNTKIVLQRVLNGELVERISETDAKQ